MNITEILGNSISKPTSKKMFLSSLSKQISPQSGFTLVEAMVALVILLILMSGATTGFLRMTENNRRNQIRGDAVSAGRRVVDDYRLDDISSLPSGTGATELRDVIINGETFNVTTTFCPADAATNFCTSNTRRHIRVEVAYPNDDNRVYYTTETVFSELN